MLFTPTSPPASTRDEKGTTAVEYGIMVALIAVVIIVAVTLLGGTLNGLFESVQCQIGGGTYGVPPTPPQGLLPSYTVVAVFPSIPDRVVGLFRALHHRPPVCSRTAEGKGMQSIRAWRCRCRVRTSCACSDHGPPRNLEFGRAYNVQTTLTNAAREGVRSMAISNSQQEPGRPRMPQRNEPSPNGCQHHVQRPRVAPSEPR